MKNSYIWGLDLSGTEQGAGGVGGLLFFSQVSGAQPSTHFVGHDGNGNVILLADAASSIATAEYEYSPFGKVVRATGSMALVNPFRFSTKYQDDETGFNYYGHRFYNPDAGRWLKRDPIKERGGKNLYAFVQNEPVSHIDLFGLQGSRCRKKCGNRTYNPTTHCCCKGKVLSKKPVNTGMRICTGWSVTGLPLWHTWIEIDGNWSADFDDNGVKAPAGPAYLAMPEGEKDWLGPQEMVPEAGFEPATKGL